MQMDTSHKDARELRQLLHKSEQGLQEATLKALQVVVVIGFASDQWLRCYHTTWPLPRGLVNNSVNSGQYCVCCC